MAISSLIYACVAKLLPFLPSAIAILPYFEKFRNGDRWIEHGEVTFYEPANEVSAEFKSLYKTEIHLVKVTEISGGLEFDRIDKQDTTFFTREENAKGKTCFIVKGKWYSVVLHPQRSPSGIIELKFQLGDTGFRFNTRIEIEK